MTKPSTVTLRFDAALPGQPVRLELSAVVQIGRDLWLGADEGATIERLSPLEPERYGAHASFPLAELIELPDADDEVDIEGMDYDGGCLWLVGSHAARRRSPEAQDADEAPKQRIRRLARTARRGNRHLLARIPINPASGAPEPGAVLPARRRRNALRDALRDDRHLAPFLDIPGKDNGFNVEGLVVRGERAWLGLRGPVLDGWALVLGVSPVGEDALELVPIERKGRLYEKHFLDLRGLGVRDLTADGSDLLILAGPTMQLDGDAAVFRWREALAARGDSLVERASLDKVLDLPYGRGEEEGVDHPEGLAMLRSEDGVGSLLVIYDSPSERRRRGKDGVLADRYPL